LIRRHGAPLVAALGRRQPTAPASPAGRPRCLPALLAPSGQGLRALLACLPPPTEQGSREQLQGAVAAAASYRPACAPAGLPPVPCASAQRPTGLRSAPAPRIAAQAWPRRRRRRPCRRL